MDVVELAIPAVVVVASKSMGVEGFSGSGSSGGGGVAVEKVEVRQSEAASILNKDSISSLGRKKEKILTTKQKNSCSNKRRDKRNGKAPKSRGYSFCPKNGLVSFNSAAGGNNFLGS